MINNNLIKILIIIFIIIIVIIAFYLKKSSNKNNQNIERTSKLSMISEKGHYGDEIDKCFRLSTIIEDNYTNLDSDIINISIILELDGKISAKL